MTLKYLKYAQGPFITHVAALLSMALVGCSQKMAGRGESAYHSGLRALQAHDSKKANDLFAQSIAENEAGPIAYKALGDSYYNGDGVKKNWPKALSFYKKAAALGYGPGQFCAASMYLEGEGTAKNLAKARHYLALAAKNKSLGPLQEDAANLLNKLSKAL